MMGISAQSYYDALHCYNGISLFPSLLQMCIIAYCSTVKRRAGLLSAVCVEVLVRDTIDHPNLTPNTSRWHFGDWGRHHASDTELIIVLCTSVDLYRYSSVPSKYGIFAQRRIKIDLPCYHIMECILLNRSIQPILIIYVYNIDSKSKKKRSMIFQSDIIRIGFPYSNPKFLCINIIIASPVVQFTKLPS